MDAESVKISFIIPVYNAARTLDRALDSVLNQTMKEIQVVAVDDASADDSVSVLRRRAAADPRLTVICQPVNRGTLSARCAAMSAVRGEYVLFLDPDDTFELNAAAELYETAQRTGADLVNFGTSEFVLRPDGSKRQVWNWITPPAAELRGERAAFDDLLLKQGHYWNLCFKLFRTDLCRRAYTFPDFYCIMGEDLVYYLPVAFAAKNLIRVHKNYYNYFIEQGVTARPQCSSAAFRRVSSLLDALNFVEDFLKREGLWEQEQYCAAFHRIEREQMSVLWCKYFSTLRPEDRSQAARELFAKARDCDRLLCAVPGVRADASADSAEFDKVVRTAYRMVNRFLPAGSRARRCLKALVRPFFRKGA